jgi:hypothetical protein
VATRLNNKQAKTKTKRIINIRDALNQVGLSEDGMRQTGRKNKRTKADRYPGTGKEKTD